MGLSDVAKLDESVNFGNDRGLLGTTRLEELDHARETARDVLLLRGFARDLHQDVAGVDRLPVLHHEVRAGGKKVTAAGLAVVALDLDARLLLFVRRVHDDQGGQARVLIDMFADRLLVEDVLEEDREREGIPLDELLGDFDFLEPVLIRRGVQADQTRPALG